MNAYLPHKSQKEDTKGNISEPRAATFPVKVLQCVYCLRIGYAYNIVNIDKKSIYSENQ